MPTLECDLPDLIHRRLAEEAERERRSLAQQAIVVLSQGLDLTERQERRRRVLEESRKIDRTITEKLPSFVDLIREDRDR